MMSPETRKRLYREGRRLLGPDRMSRLRDRGRQASARMERAGRRSAALRARLRVAPWITVRRLHRLDANTLLIGGRLDRGADTAAARIIATLHDGVEIDVTAAMHCYVDRVAARAGNHARAFALLCTLPPGSRLARLSLTLADGRRGVARCPTPVEHAERLERIIATLAPLGNCTSGSRGLLDAVLGPAAELAWNREAYAVPAEATEPRLVRYNDELAPARPRTSIVVPIYGRHDFIAHQLTYFVQDAEIRASELIYVIDDPRLQVDVARQAATLARLHDIAFSVLHLTHNVGYAGANNAAAAIARGDSLLLLNSDVLPRAPGWLGAMRDAVDGDLEGHVLGARLLYADDSVQHDGMRFEPGENFEGLWQNRHPGKGLPRDLFAQPATAQPRDAVTGACLLVSRRRYLELGGLDEGYVLGDFEDSDFCLAARGAGLTVAIAPRAVLYHLEGQSQSLVTTASWKRHLTHYNCWRHDRRWHAEIRDLVATRGTVPDAEGDDR